MTGTATSETPIEELDPIIPLAAAAKLVDCSRRILCHLIAEGLVPYAEQAGKQWILEPRSIEFLRKWYPKDSRNKMRGKGGHEQRRKIAIAAARRDPACRERAKSKLPQWWTRKPKTAPKPKPDKKKTVRKRKHHAA